MDYDSIPEKVRLIIHLTTDKTDGPRKHISTSAVWERVCCVWSETNGRASQTQSKILKGELCQ